MGRKQISEAKHTAILRLSELGVGPSEIARTLHVSRLTVHGYLHPHYYQKRLRRTRDYCRRTMLGTGTTKENSVMLTHLNKRPYPGACEVCGFAKEKGLHYHHWDKDNPSLGLWLCPRCHRLVEILDNLGSMKLGELLAKYLRLRGGVSNNAS